MKKKYFVALSILILTLALIISACVPGDPLEEAFYVRTLYVWDGAAWNQITTNGGGIGAESDPIFVASLPLTIGSGGTGQVTAGAAFNALSPMVALGDIIYGDFAGTGTRLAGDVTDARKFLRTQSVVGDAQAPVWDTLQAGDIPSLSGTYVPYAGATGNVDLNTKEVTNATLNAVVGKGTWTASGTWKLPAMYFNGDITTDRWLNTNGNTFLGVAVAGAGNLAHTGGDEGHYNTAIGYYALHNITTSFYNTAVGAYALSDLTTGEYNTAVGQLALGDVTTGKFNTAVGMQALGANTGSYNTAIGLFAGGNNIVGSSNIFLGASAGKSELGSNKLYIDVIDTATPLIYGDFSTNELTINGDLKIGANKILTTTHYIYESSASQIGFRKISDNSNIGISAGTSNLSSLAMGVGTTYSGNIYTNGYGETAIVFTSVAMQLKSATNSTSYIQGSVWRTGAFYTEVVRMQSAANPYIQLGRSDTGVTTNVVTDSVYMQAGAGTNNITANFGLGVPIYLSSDLHVLAKRASLNWVVTNPTAATYATRLDIGLMTGGALTTPLSIAGTGNVGIGTSTFDATATNTLTIYDGTAPAGGLANATQLYTTTGELYVKDSAGNQALLSPHPKQIMQSNTTSPYPWGYYARNDYLGKEIIIDMAALVEEVQKTSGKRIIFAVNDIPKRDWDADQEAMKVARDADIAQSQIQLAYMQNALKKTNDAVQAATNELTLAKDPEEIKNLTEILNTLTQEQGRLETQIESFEIPEPYVKQPIPEWIASRLK